MAGTWEATYLPFGFRESFHGTALVNSMAAYNDRMVDVCGGPGVGVLRIHDGSGQECGCLEDRHAQEGSVIGKVSTI